MCCISFHFNAGIINTGNERTIAIGLVPRNYKADKQPGWRENSVGYHADDGG